MVGAEYVDTGPSAGAMVGRQMAGAFRAAIAGHDGSVADCLSTSLDPVWNVVGRVCFHLAENRGDERSRSPSWPPTRPRLRGQGAARPLGRAIEEYAGAATDRPSRLLGPVQRAAEQSPLLSELVDSGEIYHPLAWTPAEAYGFLREVPALEAAASSCACPTGGARAARRGRR